MVDVKIRQLTRYDSLAISLPTYDDMQKINTQQLQIQKLAIKCLEKGLCS